jgi:hypothetical protein
MCKRCHTYYTIHSAIELRENLIKTAGNNLRFRDEVLELWHERGYFTNLIYLEYMSEQREKQKTL